MTKAKTIDLKGNSYAQVKERLKEFRKDNPNGLIETSFTIAPDSVTFKARILKDKANPHSAEATGHSYKVVKGDAEKVFEKQETIAVGRALAFLGYAADGEIASSEEMEEFQEYQKAQREETILAITERIGDAQTIEELKELWATVSAVYHEELKPLFAQRKEVINEASKPKTRKRRVEVVEAGEANGNSSEGLDSKEGNGAQVGLL